MNLKELYELEIKQLKERNYLPKNEMDVILHLVEEVGEVCEAIREKKSKEDLSLELADVLWQLNRICYIYDIDLETAFLNKFEKNKSR